MPRTHDRITGRTFVITGASSGLGRGTALQLAACGANVVLAARREDLLQEVAAECQAAGAATLVVPTDVASPAQVEELAAQAIARFGGIDTWINNAGVGALGPFWDIPLADHSRVIDVNLKGTLYGSYVAVRHFRARGRGTLVNIGSIDSSVPLAYQSSYAAAKGGVLSLGRLLNEELRLADQEHIKVATVMPWAADTPWWEHAANYSGGTPRMAAMDDPAKVVDAIVAICVDPKEELAVGWKAKASHATHRISPDLGERFSASVAHKWQIEDAPPAGATTASLYEPMQSGRGVEGGVRERMEREDAQRDR